MDAGNFGLPVDNGLCAYVMVCNLTDQGGTFGDVRLVGVTIEYRYSEM